MILMFHMHGTVAMQCFVALALPHVLPFIPTNRPTINYLKHNLHIMREI